MTIVTIYITVSLVCDPLAFRLISLFGLVFSASPIPYALLYPLLDMLTRSLGRAVTIKLIVLFHFSDFLFSYLLYFINLLPAPVNFHSLVAFNTVILPLPRLFWSGIIGAMLSGIVEVLIYAFFQKRFNSFFLSSFLATTIILFGHNVPTELLALKTSFPTNYVSIVATNFGVSIFCLAIYAALAGLILKYIGIPSRKK